MDLSVQLRTELFGGRAIIRLLGEAAEDQSLQVFADFGASRPWRGRSLGDVLACDL
jgi:hypothetical protein